MASQQIEIPVSKDKREYVYPSQVVERKSNNRFVYGMIPELVKSITVHGIIEPLHVRKLKTKTADGFQLYEAITGNRRIKASHQIAKGMTEESQFVPVIVHPENISLADMIMLSVSTDAHGLTRSQIELAYDANSLITNEGWKQKDVAVAFGKSAMYISDCMKFLTEANEELIQQVKSGLIPFTTALDMIKSGDTGVEVAETVNKVLDKKKAKAAAQGDEVINPDKNANVKNSVKKSELLEASGKPKSVSKSAPETSVKAAGSDAPKAPKTDDSMLKLKQLHTALCENKATKRVGFKQCLEMLIDYCHGSKNMLEVMPFFFWGFDEEFDQSYKEKAMKVPAKIAPAEIMIPEPAAKPANVHDSDDLDEDELDAPPAPAAKTTKKAPAVKKAEPAKKGKGKKADVDEGEAELEELPEGDDFDDEIE